MSKESEILARGGQLVFSNTPDGLDALVVADLARQLARGNRDAPAALLHIARERTRMVALERALSFFAPDIDVLIFPAWDVLPYDRASPAGPVSAQRMTTLARLARTKQGARPRIVLTTANGAVQRVTSRKLIAAQSLSVAPGNSVDLDGLILWLENNGYLRTSTVRDTGEYAVRGGILDLYPPGHEEPVRLDFFGDTLESIRPFDPETQRSTGQLRALDLVPASEVLLTEETMRRFRQAYVKEFGAAERGDALYEAVSEGRRYPGMEHWLPLFQDGMETILDHLPGAPVVLDHLAEDAAAQRLAQAADYYEARASGLEQQAGGVPYRPLKPDRLYLGSKEFAERVKASGTARVYPFDADIPAGATSIDTHGRPARDFAPERADDNANVFAAASRHIAALIEANKRVVVAAWSDGSRERMCTVLEDHGLGQSQNVGTWADAQSLPKNKIAFAVTGLEAGFETPDFAIVAEQDILGDRLVRAKKKSRRAQDFLTEVTALSAGDLVVHVDHGIGRYMGLKAIAVSVGAPHDCLEIHYAADAKLFLPVENVELLSRYGSEDTEVQLDKLGGVGWQTRKAKPKQRIREIAGELIKVAAARAMREANRMQVPEGIYDEFAARFPFEETEDQQNSINATLDDLAAGRPMDRLVCGDVGFGKTEVAMRAAFVTAMNGKQVALVVPTTLLARQHYKTFSERFRGFPLKVAQASRFVSAGEMKTVRDGLADGSVDVVVGTHALLAKNISFKDLGLVIVDEEQHFGVVHKERLKQLRAEVHVLTLTATPIPRTLQLALTGVRELSIIATPPVDRLAVRTTVVPFDPMIVREALLRERYRGGQSFYVVPRIEDIATVREFLTTQVPEVKFAVGHGQMAAGELEDVMTAFYEGKYDVLISTTIVESGLDIPNANTLIAHRADMFGLAQLYQLRGRVGRSKTRAYALLTVPQNKALTANAEKRLKVLQSLDSLGAGFQLASHDLDIRGAGNLLGDEQSGHIREVGYELYQQMLEEAVSALKEGGEIADEQWSPNIAIGTPVLIPDTYVEDLDLRLGLYRRLASLTDDAGIDAFGVEMADRFGPPPPEVNHLLRIVGIKALCRRANVDRVEAGPKGALLSFRDNSFANPDGPVAWLSDQRDVSMRPDFRLVFRRDWETAEERLKGTTTLMRKLVEIAEKSRKAA